MQPRRTPSQENWENKQKVFIPNHPDTLARLNNLCTGWVAQGRRAQAVEKLREALQDELGQARAARCMHMHRPTLLLATVRRLQDCESQGGAGGTGRRGRRR